MLSIVIAQHPGIANSRDARKLGLNPLEVLLAKMGELAIDLNLQIPDWSIATLRKDLTHKFLRGFSMLKPKPKSKSKKIGRPAAVGQSVGLKPYLSPEAIALLDRQPSKSQYVANLIEKETSNMMSEAVKARVEKAIANMKTKGVEVDGEFLLKVLDISKAPCWDNQLKVITVADEKYKIIPRNDVTMTFLGRREFEMGREAIEYYLVSSPTASGDCSLEHHFCEGKDEGCRVRSIDTIPDYLLAKLAA